MGYTSIQIMPQTRKRLSRLKEDGRQTYDSVLNRLMALIPSEDDEGEYSDEFRIGLLNAKLQIRRGETVPSDEAKKALGL